MSIRPSSPILETQDLDARDQPMLDDPVKIAADQLGRALRAHPSRHPHFSVDGTAGDPLLERDDVAAGKGDLGQMKFRHGLAMPN